MNVVKQHPVMLRRFSYRLFNHPPSFQKKVRFSTNGDSVPPKQSSPKSTELNKDDNKNKNQSSLPKSAASRISDSVSSTLTYYERTYEDIEQRLMRSINENNQRRFRIYFFGSIGLLIITSVVFGDKIRKAVSNQTAGIAEETLKNESLKIQTQELAMAVVQTVLNDKDITARAANFLREASNTPETQEALLSLTLHTLQHPQSLAELEILTKKLINSLANDKETVDVISKLFAEVFATTEVQTAAVNLLAELCKDPVVLKSIIEMLITVFQRAEIEKSLVDLMHQTSSQVLQDNEMKLQSRKFVTDVMGDDTLQREGGTALWKSVLYALQPGFVRLTGACLIAVSFATLKIFLSPF